MVNFKENNEDANMPKKMNDPYQKAARFKKVVRVIITILSILCADLLISFTNSKIIQLGNNGTLNKLLVTAMGMGMVLLLFFLLIEYLNDLAEFFMKFFVEVGRNVMGRKRGLLVMFVVLLFILCSSYYFIWFNRNLPMELWYSLKQLF